MAKGLESYQHQVTLMEQKARNCGRGGRKAPTTRRRRSSRRPPRRKVLAHNVESSAREAMVCKDDDMADSTGYSTDGFERDEQQFIYDLERLSVPPKSVSDVKSMTQDGAPFAFQKRVERIDWRSLHSIDVDRLIREVDIDTLETVLDTIVFGDIQGEDRRNLSEANFVKIFRLAQLMVEYLLHVQALLAYHKSELLQSRSVLQQKNEKIRSRFLWQRDALLHTRHDLKQAKKALQTYEVMLKIQGKNQLIQACQSNPKQVRHCHLCEKVFESPYYLNLHIARKHQQKQEVTEDKVLALVSRAEEATAARVKEEMSLAVQAEIQLLRKRYQADLRRTETGSNTQVRTLQEDLRQSDNRFHDVQARLEVLQAQIHSASPNKPKEKEDGPNQERLYELESRFSGLEHRLKTLGQENSRLLEELNVAYTKVSDLQFAKQQNVIQLETQVNGLQKENQQLKRTITKVNNIAEVTGEKPAEPYPEAYNQSPGNPTMDPVLICTSRLHSSALPKSLHPEVPRESFEMHEDTTNINRYVHIQKIPEPILAIIERKEPAIQTSDVLDFQKLNDTTDLALIDEEPVALTPRERWTKEPDKDQALLALASPIPGIRRTEESSADSNAEPSEQESSAGPEHSRHSRSAGKRALGLPPQKMKYETSSERIKKPHKETPRLVAVKKITPRGDESPTTVEEMRAKLEKEMTAAHEEQKRRQRAVERLLAKELVNEKSETRKKGKQTKSENSRSCKPATQLSQTPKVVTPRVSIAPLILALHTKEETPNPSSSTIHEVRKIVSSLSPKDIGVKSAEIKRAPATTRPKPGPGNGTQTRLLRPPPPYPPGPGCKRSLPAVHPYLRPGLGNPQAQPPTSFHMAVLNSNPASSHNQPPNNIIPPSKEHIIERLGAVTRELGKYFPPQKPSVEKAISDTVKIVQPILKPEIETTETETNETEEDDAEPRNTRSLEYEMIQEVAKVAASDVSEVAPAMPIPEGLSEQPSVSIPALPNLAERFPHSETACEELHQAKANESIDGQICEELKKFGITLSTNGISDTTYNSISSALEMQRLLRMSQIYGNDRNILEYERGAVAWHTQRAICDRDKAIIESQVTVTESGFGSEVDGTENRAGETGRSHYSLTTGLVQNHKKNEFDSKSRDELTLARASHRRSNEQSGPQSSESSGSSDSLQEAVESNNKNQFVSRAKHLSSSKADGRKYFSPRSRPHEGQPQHASRAFALKPTQKQAKSSRNNRDRPSSRGELVRSSPEFVDNRWQPELDEEEVEEDLGLGDWDSDDDTVPSRGKQR